VSCSHLTSVGAYVLGALDPADRADFEDHLAGCETCKAELLRMAPLPGLLHRISVEDFEDQPPIEPVAAIVELPRERPKRRRLLVLAAAAAVVIALGVGTIFITRAQRDPDPVPVAWSATNSTSGVGADVALTDRAWGTEVRITLHDIPPGKPCKLVVVARDGTREIAGWWSTSYVPGEAIPGSTSIDLTHIASVKVVTDDDRVLVTVPAPT
jgi:hypothetical protein